MLAVEASGPRAAIAVFGPGGEVRAVRHRAAAFEHARILAALVDETLRAAGVPPHELEGIAVDVGPGSFTALRIALATAHGLAQPAGARVVGVTSFAALVEGLVRPRRVVIPLVPAGRMLLYAGFYRSDAQGKLTLLHGPAVGDIATLATTVGEVLALRAASVLPHFVGPGAARERAALEARWPGSTGDGDEVDAAEGPAVEAVARIGARLLAPSGHARPAPDSGPDGSPRPLYVRVPQAVENLPAERPSWRDLAAGPFTEADLDEAIAIEQAVFSDPWPRQFFLEEIRHDGSRAVAVRSRGILAGYLLAWRLDHEWHLGNIAVAPAFQRRGVGRFMLETLVREADAAGDVSITLEVRPSNFAAQELYRRFGFRAVALRRGYYQDTGEDALIMMRDPRAGA
jgi:ribosomal-protein-alanine N-acetyltransferase